MNLGITDIVLLLCFLPAAIEGLRKGLIKQIFAIAAVIIGFITATHYNPEFAPKLAEWSGSGDIRIVKVVSFTIILLATALIVNAMGILVTKLFDFATIGWANRLLGLLFGLLKTALVLMIAIYLFDSLNLKWKLIDTDTLDASIIYSYLREQATSLFPRLKELSQTVNV